MRSAKLMNYAKFFAAQLFKGTGYDSHKTQFPRRADMCYV